MSDKQAHQTDASDADDDDIITHLHFAVLNDALPGSDNGSVSAVASKERLLGL